MQKTTIQKVDGQSVDLIQENLVQLKQIFPEVIKEGRVDFEALNEFIGQLCRHRRRAFLSQLGRQSQRTP